ncbi:MAG: putative diguanylate cyclase [Modestobacter sp.]|nr:putative diguanylate cyclase [Modestobacter sp.]MCW2677953.1 putative diguanylate cyclase [Modestobacter sp.]
MGRGRSAGVRLLVLLHALGGLFCLIGAAWPMSPDTPVGLAWALGITGLVVAAVLWAVGDRSPVVPHVALGLLTLLVALLASRSATAAGIVGLGPVLIALGLYAAHFFSRTAARAHMGAAAVLVSLGALVAEPAGFLLPWVIAVVTAGALTEAQGRLTARLREAASTDPLTGLANRRAWTAEADRSLARARRAGVPVTIAILDLDDFKAVNDRDGHGAGDALLRQLTAEWSQRLRASDLLGRHGGDEFVLCLPDTDLDGAQEVLDRLAEGAPASWSVGAAMAAEGDTLSALLQRADTELYLDKRRRRSPGPLPS